MMNGFWNRFKYYMIGLVLGSFAVYFMFGSRSDLRCDYFPNARVLKNMRGKTMHYTATAACQRDCLQLDSLAIKQIFAAGAVIFSESEPRKKPCGEYKLTTRLPDTREVSAWVRNCDSSITIVRLHHSETECPCPEP